MFYEVWEKPCSEVWREADMVGFYPPDLAALVKDVTPTFDGQSVLIDD